MKTAVVHDWLLTMRGGERCLEAILELFPQADIFTLFYLPERISPSIKRHRIFASRYNRLGPVRKHYRWFLPFFPAAIADFNLAEYDLVISVSHCVAHGVRTNPDAVHLSYTLTPMRYIWDAYEDYIPSHPNPLVRYLGPMVASRLRDWDARASRGVDHFIAISQFVAKRIADCYGRESEIIHPPVDTAFFDNDKPSGEYFLFVGGFARNKRLYLAVEAFNRLRLPLLLVGEGPEKRRLVRMASQQIRFLDYAPPERLRELYAGCRAVVFPSLEDFGIVPIEALASGRPVIGFAGGGLLETITPDVGVLFTEPTIESLIGAIKRFMALERSFDISALKQHAKRFDRSVFFEKFSESVRAKIARKEGTRFQR